MNFLKQKNKFTLFLSSGLIIFLVGVIIWLIIRGYQTSVAQPEFYQVKTDLFSNYVSQKNLSEADLARVDFNLDQLSGIYAKATFSFLDEANSQRNLFYIKAGDQWKLIFDLATGEKPSCEKMNKYAFPSNMTADCQSEYGAKNVSEIIKEGNEDSFEYAPSESPETNLLYGVIVEEPSTDCGCLNISSGGAELIVENVPDPSIYDLGDQVLVEGSLLVDENKNQKTFVASDDSVEEINQEIVLDDLAREEDEGDSAGPAEDLPDPFGQINSPQNLIDRDYSGQPIQIIGN